VEPLALGHKFQLRQLATETQWPENGCSGNWLATAARNFDWICSHWNGYGFIALRMV